MPGTPPIIEPLEVGDRAPDTQRDTELALRAERRRWLMVGMVSVVIAGVALGGYLAGKRERVTPPEAAVPTAKTTPTVSATAPSASATSPEVAPSALPAATASATPSSQPSATLAPEPPKVQHRRLRRPAAPVDNAAEPKPELPAAPVRDFPSDPQ
jgi:hypothetical protein